MPEDEVITFYTGESSASTYRYVRHGPSATQWFNQAWVYGQQLQQVNTTNTTYWSSIESEIAMVCNIPDCTCGGIEISSYDTRVCVRCHGVVQHIGHTALETMVTVEMLDGTIMYYCNQEHLSQDTNIASCATCEAYDRVYAMYIVDLSRRDERLCRDCFTENYVVCSPCGSPTLIEDVEEVDGAHLCTRCYADCVTCDNCGDVCYDTNENEDGDVYCRRCYRDNRAIHDWNYRPKLTFYNAKTASDKPSSNCVYFGVEIEMEATNTNYTRGDLARIVKDNVLPFYCMEDGSLNNGVEMASHPSTLGYWRKNTDDLAKLCSKLVERGARSYQTTTCGLHVHVNRTAFKNTNHLYHFMKLIYDNPMLALVVSNRRPRELERWASIDREDQRTLERKAEQWVTGDSMGDRYVAVNLTHQGTAEVRLFKGTLNPVGIIRCIEFVSSAIRYTNHITSSQCGQAQFVDWIIDKEGSKLYPTLREFMLRKKDALTVTQESEGEY